jgi:hypothetical protein
VSHCLGIHWSVCITKREGLQEMQDAEMKEEELNGLGLALKQFVDTSIQDQQVRKSIPYFSTGAMFGFKTMPLIIPLRMWKADSLNLLISAVAKYLRSKHLLPEK